MNPKQFILIAFCVLTNIFSNAQDQSGNKSVEPIAVKVTWISPYYVLKAGDKSIGIDMKTEGKFDINAIDPEGIKEIQVLKGEDATNKYGNKGVNGVVIIFFKESYILPADLQARFDDTK